MEVHHSSLTTTRKKWTHYFWEFLMLFLAVFCGFFAEYQLEHKIEKDREKQYMRSMVKDLVQDVRNIGLDIKNRELKRQIADSLTQMLIQGNYNDKTGLIYYCARRFSIVGYVFHMTDGTLIQLRNSGGLRLIRRQDVVDSLQGYYNLFQRYEDNRELEMLQLRDYRDIMIQVFDVKVFDLMVRDIRVTNLPAGNPPLHKNDETTLNELLMRVHLSKRISLLLMEQLKDLRERGENLITQIKTEYNLK
jgi:hypothetical protein